MAWSARLAWLGGLALSFACGGKSASDLERAAGAGPGGSAAFAAGGTVLATGGSDSAGTDVGGAAGRADTSGAPAIGGGGAEGVPSGAAGEPENAGAGGTTPVSEYVPAQAVPFDHAYFDNGSFEMGAGDGWDFCYTRTAGNVRINQGSGSEGTNSFEVEAAGACSDTCSPTAPSSSQVYMWWFASGKQPPEAPSLYFDVLNLSQTPPNGILRFEAVDIVCEHAAPLAEIPLADLMPPQSWETRCVDLPSFGMAYGLGVAVSGPAFHVALDAFRLGPPCH